jgi:hypothetical protein
VGGWLARANTIPGFVQSLAAAGAEPVRLGTFTIASPNIVFYAAGPVHQFVKEDVASATAFLASGPDAILLVPEQKFSMLEAELPAGYGVVGRTRPLFRPHDVVAIGRIPPADRTARGGEVAR